MNLILYLALHDNEWTTDISPSMTSVRKMGQKPDKHRFFSVTAFLVIGVEY